MFCIFSIQQRKNLGKAQGYRFESQTLTATTPDEIHPQLDPTPILTPLPKTTTPQSRRIEAQNIINSKSQKKGSRSMIYAVSTQSLASQHSNPEVVTLLQRHPSKTSVSSKHGETHV